MVVGCAVAGGSGVSVGGGRVGVGDGGLRVGVLVASATTGVSVGGGLGVFVEVAVGAGNACAKKLGPQANKLVPSKINNRVHFILMATNCTRSGDQDKSEIA